MKKINEREVSQKNYLNGKSWSWWIKLILVILSILVFIILIWGFAFKGFLYIEYKNKTKKYYSQIVIQENNEEVCNQLDRTSEKFIYRCEEFREKRNVYYDYQKENDVVIKYLNIYQIESLASKSYIIFSLTNTYFNDIRIEENENNEDLLMSSIFFVYKKENQRWYLEDLLFQYKDIEKLGEYK
ncbi:hypothetical protein [Spiroplasma endosymbiont of Cantharis rufa]|uniref:hypothetical protein n=1 Tax=Spiroplasma endosymbiont of Cantharis rufa TaxID=3066279 RepID=UPI0030D5A503